MMVGDDTDKLVGWLFEKECCPVRLTGLDWTVTVTVYNTQ